MKAIILILSIAIILCIFIYFENKPVNIGKIPKLDMPMDNIEIFYIFSDEYAIKNWHGRIIGFKNLAGEGECRVKYKNTHKYLTTNKK